MEVFQRKLGRRQFMTVSSMILGAGVLGAGTFLRPETANAQLNQGAPRTLHPQGKTKWGHCIFLPPPETVDGERGTPYVQYGSGIPETALTPGAQMRMVPHMAPYPAHPVPEKHKEYQEVLCMIGLDPTDPLNLGAEAEFYMGKGKTLEKYPKVTKSVCVYVPRGQWHWPWQVKKVHHPMAWIHFNVPVTPMPAMTEEDLEKLIREEEANGPDPKELAAELANAKTDPRTFLYKHLLCSGVGVDKRSRKAASGSYIWIP